MKTNVLPNRLFADHQEPVGDRVNSYFKLDTIDVILKAFTPNELSVIRPCFGKMIDMYHKPAHSSKLAHFLLTWQLKTEKRHELWFIFGDENVTGEKLEVMLRHSKNISSELKVKYAYLLIVDGLLCRKSSGMKIPKDHAEMIRDLCYFLSFPWRQHCLEMTVQCIKSRSTNQLAQPTVAVQGFIHTVQMVLLEAVPAALMTMGEENGSESEEEECVMASTLKLDKLWNLDSSGQLYPL
ncbi:unnamed protein product [Thlaspi arvense]|uniref:DUF1985 domain-containing protein n=1 Tax=Thlaspi arvense TaxID=13288 RepID=A0AAU9RUK8_THLAR|nr:unnamed protein product [Thlaspi arvense]